MTAGGDVRGWTHPDDGHRASVGSRHQLHLARLALEAEATQQPPVQAAGLGVDPLGADGKRGHVGAGGNGWGEGSRKWPRCSSSVENSGRERRLTLAARAPDEHRGTHPGCSQ